MSVPTGPDVTLPLWRRLDWRFLLPEPLGGTLLVGGTPDPLLLAALPLLSEVRVVHDPQPADVLYLVDPEPEELRALLPSLRGGGVLYVEVSRRSGAGLVRTTPAAWARRVRRAGVRDVRVHWHAPDFVARTRVVPCEDGAAVRDTVSRHDGRRAGVVQAAAARVVQRTGLLPLVVSHASLTGRRG